MDEKERRKRRREKTGEEKDKKEEEERERRYVAMIKKIKKLKPRSPRDCKFIAGGIIEKDPNDPSHMVRVWRGVKDLNERSKSNKYHLIPILVVSATSQPVEGTKWVYEVLVGESESLRDSISASEL
ncbi:hypothetical protein PMAYCL1PPCAC_01315 [Pristionchus mayeri]|uniref:Uncharacterized protein n=1 Tax=Pristionchus mayeri TaxID=1317129 RepID=A0AAN4Z4I8_9BILA|nr:hypothetical protein PMAYCL1PPCAC_01315 [Pristionchus mayeri]